MSKYQNKTYHVAYAFGRVCLASLFILGALNKLVSPQGYLQRISESIAEPAVVILVMVVLAEGVGGLLLAMGHRTAWLSAALLSIFTLLTNVFLHRFWEIDAPFRVLELSLFFKNVSLAGALILVAVTERIRIEKTIKTTDLVKHNS